MIRFPKITRRMLKEFVVINIGTAIHAVVELFANCNPNPLIFLYSFKL